MDKGSDKRVALFLSLLFFVMVGCAFSIWGWMEAAHTEELEKLGQCLLLKPESEGDYVSIFMEKNGVDREKAISAGKETAEKYGYAGRYNVYPRYLTSFFRVVFWGFVSIVLLIVFLILAQRSQRKRLEIINFELDDKVAQLEEENHLLREKMEREEVKTKELVTDISHQLKTPLAALEMCYEIAETSSFTMEEQQSFLMQGKSQVIKLEKLTKSLIQLSRLETNMILIEGKPESLKKTLQGAVNSVYMKAFDKGITLSVAEFEDAVIFHDPKWTQEAFVNVLDNAVKYSDPGTEIEVRPIPMTSYYLIEIEDQGIGISKEERNEIFKRFYRGKDSGVQETEGSGVGLYLARKILEDQGGSIRVKSGKRGSIFQITIPKNE